MQRRGVRGYDVEQHHRIFSQELVDDRRDKTAGGGSVQPIDNSPTVGSVIVDELDAGGSVLRVRQLPAPQCLKAAHDIVLREVEQNRQKFTREQDR